MSPTKKSLGVYEDVALLRLYKVSVKTNNKVMCYQPKTE